MMLLPSPASLLPSPFSLLLALLLVASLLLPCFGFVKVPIWIGPAQEGDSANACSLAWPALKPWAKCPAPLGTVRWTNVTLRNVRVIGAKVSPGIIFGNATSPMEGVVFDGVVFDPVDPKARPWGESFYYCEGVHGVATGGTTPVPPCFVQG